jgi:hypothetical protein
MTMSRKENEPFEVHTYIGGSPAEFSTDGERPPKSAKHVATVSWSWGPAHSDCQRYLISTDRQRKGWTLWAMAYGDHGRMYAELAYARPFRGYTAKFAAERLLTAVWKAEQETWYQDYSGGRVDEEGLLTKTDVENIERAVFGARE